MESRPPSPSRFTGQRIHFIGIGGSGMSGLARMLLDNGAIVSGSEPNYNTQTLDLIKRGARITRDQTPEHLPSDLDLVVRSAAVKDTNPQFAAACSRRSTARRRFTRLGRARADAGILAFDRHSNSVVATVIRLRQASSVVAET